MVRCAGARLQSLVFRKCVLQMHWGVRVLPDGGAHISAHTPSKDSGSAGSCTDADEAVFRAAMLHLESLTDCLEVCACAMQCCLCCGQPLLQ